MSFFFFVGEVEVEFSFFRPAIIIEFDDVDSFSFPLCTLRIHLQERKNRLLLLLCGVGHLAMKDGTRERV